MSHDDPSISLWEYVHDLTTRVKGRCYTAHGQNGGDMDLCHTRERSSVKTLTKIRLGGALGFNIKRKKVDPHRTR